MYQGIYKIAGHTVKINSIYSRIHKMCAAYKTKEPYEFGVSIRQEDIIFEYKKSQAKNFAEDYLETLAVYRKLAELLIDYDILLFHGSAIVVDDEAYLFTAKSGTGKSTHTRLWRELFGARAVMVNDDKPLLHVTKNGVTVYGTPWDGKHHLSSNISVPLKSICYVCRDNMNHIERISKNRAYPILLGQTYRPVDQDKMTKTLALLELMAAKTELYQLGCNMEPEAAKVSYEGMRASQGGI